MQNNFRRNMFLSVASLCAGFLWVYFTAKSAFLSNPKGSIDVTLPWLLSNVGAAGLAWLVAHEPISRLSAMKARLPSAQTIGWFVLGIIAYCVCSLVNLAIPGDSGKAMNVQIPPNLLLLAGVSLVGQGFSQQFIRAIVKKDQAAQSIQKELPEAESDWATAQLLLANVAILFTYAVVLFNLFHVVDFPANAGESVFKEIPNVSNGALIWLGISTVANTTALQFNATK